MKFENRKDGYYNIHGLLYPSVTTILKVISKPALVPWALLQGIKIQKEHNPQTNQEALRIFNEVSEKAKTRGSNIHHLQEAFFKYGELPDLLAPDGYFKALQAFHKDYEIEPVFVETELYSTRYQIAGTCDFMGLIKERKRETWKVVVADWKTNAKATIYKEVQLQLSAYAHMAREMGLLTDIDTLFVVVFGEDGKYKVKEFEEDFESFLAVKALFDWSKRK